MKEYPKIVSPFLRETQPGPNRNKLIVGQYVTPEIQFLAPRPWTWTEKVDGTNIRVGWDGHRVTFGGRTDAAQIPAKLVDRLRTLFPEELLEQAFGGNAATLYGEGYGAGIGKTGRNYSLEQSFVLFDVLVGQWWLRRGDVEDVATKLGLDVVPIVMFGPISAAVERVRNGIVSAWSDAPAEGLVGKNPVGLLDRAGDPIIVKVKAKDFPSD